MRFFIAWVLPVFSLVVATTSWAAPSTSVMSAEDRAALLHPWDFSLALAHYESLYNQEDGNQLSLNTMATILSYKINRDYKISGEVDFLQDTINPENNDVAGASLKLEHRAFKIADHLLILTPSLSTDIPVSQYDHHVTLQGSLGGALKVAVNPEFLISKRLSLSVGLTGKRYFNTYSEAEDGSPNAEYGATQSFNAGWDFTRWLTLALSVGHYDYWDYYGILQEYYGHNEELDFNINKMWQVAVGHSYGNPLMPFVPVWKADGSDGNYSFLSEQYSTVYAQVTVSF
jgi:hypothetical protein